MNQRDPAAHDAPGRSVDRVGMRDRVPNPIRPDRAAASSWYGTSQAESNFTQAGSGEAGSLHRGLGGPVVAERKMQFSRLASRRPPLPTQLRHQRHRRSVSTARHQPPPASGSGTPTADEPRRLASAGKRTFSNQDGQDASANQAASVAAGSPTHPPGMRASFAVVVSLVAVVRRGLGSSLQNHVERRLRRFAYMGEPALGDCRRESCEPRLGPERRPNWLVEGGRDADHC